MDWNMDWRRFETGGSWGDRGVEKVSGGLNELADWGLLLHDTDDVGYHQLYSDIEITAQ